jgi:hypothetical protein
MRQKQPSFLYTYRFSICFECHPLLDMNGIQIHPCYLQQNQWWTAINLGEIERKLSSVGVEDKM